MGKFIRNKKGKENKNIKVSGAPTRIPYSKGGVPSNNFLKFIYGFDPITHLLLKSSARKEFKSIVKQNIREIPSKIVDAIGGSKNIRKIKNTTNSITVLFKSYYFIHKDSLEKCGGVGLFYGNHSVTMVFGWRESKKIAKDLRLEIKRVKKMYKPMLID